MANYIKATIHADYEYMGHFYDFEDEDIGEGMELFANVLAYNLEMTKDIYQYDRDVERVLEDAVQIARNFVDEMHPTAASTHLPTHRLRESIGYSPYATGGYNGGKLFANAVDDRGHPYAGHVEYGFTDRQGMTHGPWPFLRPAMRLAAAASQKNFADTMAQIITNGFARDSGVIRFGSHNIQQNIAQHDSVSRVARTYGKSSPNNGRWEQRYGGRWQGAKNGIGFKSGPQHRDYNYSDKQEFERGAL